MLYKKNNSNSYIQEFSRRFTNFCDKAPCRLSFTTTPLMVQVIDESTGIVYEKDWNFSIPVQDFIHGIKQELIVSAYPVIKRAVDTEVLLTSEEQVDIASEGVALDEVPTRKYQRTYIEYLIDKCIIYRDIVILKDKETGERFRYQMSKSVVYFLEKIRKNRFNSEQAGEYFFRNSTLLNKIEKRREEEVEGNEA